MDVVKEAINMYKTEEERIDDVKKNVEKKVKEVEKTLKEMEEVREKKVVQEGKYVKTYPENVGTESEGYNTYLTLKDNNVEIYEEYWESTKKGTYEMKDDKLIIHITNASGVGSLGDGYDDSIDITYICHFENDKLIIESIEQPYEPMNHVYELVK